MIHWLWLIPTALISAGIGLLSMSWLIAGKIADLENALWTSQMSWENPLPFLGAPAHFSIDAFLGNKEPNC